MASKAGKPAETNSEQALVSQAESGDNKALAVDQEFENFFYGESSDFGQQDLSIPFLRMVQSLSPYVQRGDAKYSKEAMTGMIVETVTPRFFDGEEGIFVIPVLYQRSYTEWAPNRGGLVKDHGQDPSILAQCKRVKDNDGKTRVITPDGNELAEAAQYFVLYTDNLEGGFWEQAILTMSGTQWKKARDWNTNMSRVRIQRPDGSLVKNPLPFALCYRLTTNPEKKDNYNFFGWKIKPVGFTLNIPRGGELARAASEFRRLAAEGKVRGAEDGITDDEAIPGFEGEGAGNFM